MFLKTTEYALRAVLYIAREGHEDRRVSLAAVARAIGSPASFTAKIMQQLSRDNRIVCSVRGPGGGFYMTRASRQLPMQAILEAMGEEHLMTKCVLGLRQCSEKQPCPMHEAYQPVKAGLMRLFTHHTIGEMAGEPEWRKRLQQKRRPGLKR
jgi:Rrf2 family protein